MILETEKIIYDMAIGLVGLPYIWGGDDPIKGFDCSGLCLEILSALGRWKSGDTTAQGLFNNFKFKPDAAQFGSLAFFGSSTSHITHVGFCLNDKLMLEAGGGGSSTVSSEAAAKQNAYVRIRPIARRSDLVAIRSTL